MSLKSTGWDRYLLALASYQREDTATTRRAMGVAYADWVSDFAPDQAERLIAEFAKRINPKSPKSEVS